MDAAHTEFPCIDILPPAPGVESAINPAPTPHPELNQLLFRLVEGVRATLGETFVAAYLQGPFALGDHDAAGTATTLGPVRRVGRRVMVSTRRRLCAPADAAGAAEACAGPPLS